MKFADLSINQTFTVQEYPECIGVKVKHFGGSCCTPPHNAKMICQVNDTPQEQAVMIDDGQEVTLQPSEVAVQPKELQSPQTLQVQLDIGAAEREIDNRTGYKWHGPGPDPTVEAVRKAQKSRLGPGGTFGGDDDDCCQGNHRFSGDSGGDK